jgi:hypothetical protein
MSPDRHVVLADPNDPKSSVVSMWCCGCSQQLPASSYSPSRVQWRRGHCRSCDTKRQRSRLQADPILAKLHALRVAHGCVLLSREQLAKILADNGILAIDKESLRNVKIRKIQADTPLGMENCIITQPQTPISTLTVPTEGGTNRDI